MAEISALRAVILSKTEVSYGTDPTPTKAANAMMVKNFTLKPLVQKLQELSYATPYPGSKGSRVVANYVTCSFDIPLAGSGTAGVAPAWAPELKACGASETVVADTSVAYVPIQSSIPTLTRYIYFDGVLHKMLGARNEGVFRLPENDEPVLHVESIGLYAAVSDAAMPSDPDLSDFLRPPVINKVNTTTYTLDGAAIVPSSTELAIGNKIEYSNLPNEEAVRWYDRMSTLSAEFKAATVATKDWWAIARAETEVEFQFVNGATAGNIATLLASYIQLTDPDYTEKNGRRFLRVNGAVKPSSAGNDEWSLTLT